MASRQQLVTTGLDATAAATAIVLEAGRIIKTDARTVELLYEPG